jgi:hypothetical protein
VTIDPGMEHADPAETEDDLVANRTGHLGRGQRRLLERTLLAYRASDDPTALAIRRALDTDQVSKVEGAFEYLRRGGGKSTYWQWSLRDREGKHHPLVALVAPWPGEGAAYMLTESLICIGCDAPSPDQLSRAKQLQCALQALSESQLAALEGGLMPKGIWLARRVTSSRRARVGFVAAYAGLSLVSTILVNLYPHRFLTRTGMYASAFVFCAVIGVLLALSVRRRPAGTAVRVVEGPVSIGEARIGLESTIPIRVGEAEGVLPYWVGHALVHGARVRAYVDAASNDIVAVLPV